MHKLKKKIKNIVKFLEKYSWILSNNSKIKYKINVILNDMHFFMMKYTKKIIKLISFIKEFYFLNYIFQT